MNRPAALLLAYGLLAPGAAIAGSGNTLYLLQDGADGSNSFVSDQSLSDNSSIGSLSSPARQTGHGNQANVTIRSDCAAAPVQACGYLFFQQDNSMSGLAGLAGPLDVAPNSATVVINGYGSGRVQQLGGGNNASLDVTGGQGTIFQAGLNNSASLTVAPGAKGTISQTGNGNSGGLSVTSIGGGGASLIQAGNGHSYSDNVSVSTTTSVTIYQLGF